MTLTNYKAAIAAFAVVTTAATAASAATVTFDLNGNDSTNFNKLDSSFDITEGGLTATFDGKAFRSLDVNGESVGQLGYSENGTITDADIRDGHIGRYYGGVGIVNSAGDGSHTVDGRGWDDFVQISFGQDILVDSISFGFFDKSDRFRVIADKNNDDEIGVGDFLSNTVDIPGNGTFTDASLTNFFGSTNTFAIGAFGYHDSWKLQSITVSYTEMAAVPLPASGLLLLAGFGGLAAMRRRQKSA